MKRLATLFALAGTALAIGCGNGPELQSMNFGSYETYEVDTVGHAIQTAPRLQPPAKLFGG